MSTSPMFREGSVHYCHPVQGIPQSGHPVIIIKLLGGAAVLGTVTSHGAGKFKGTEKAIPWIRNRTHARRIHHFRAFNGSAKPNWRPLLELEPGQRWPMPEASWIEVDRVFEAPLSTLGRFTKMPRPSTQRLSSEVGPSPSVNLDVEQSQLVVHLPLFILLGHVPCVYAYVIATVDTAPEADP
ncbi:hypothetical protein DL546_006281 [Coniochaeta pulveracea]|uniref:Uncharacterized protein n=1 Tax=Coniochaeta pulveracea TaxID=177199 RepID=A0A420Y5X3_9PEZI|nr:hypothetical protein DL546_006281 [Coniochaeta pulveracea]